MDSDPTQPYTEAGQNLLVQIDQSLRGEAVSWDDYDKHILGQGIRAVEEAAAKLEMRLYLSGERLHS